MPVFVCTECNSSFITMNRLRRHQERMRHGGTPTDYLEVWRKAQTENVSYQDMLKASKRMIQVPLDEEINQEAELERRKGKWDG